MSPTGVRLVWMNGDTSEHEMQSSPESGSWHTIYLFFLKTALTVRKVQIKGFKVPSKQLMPLSLIKSDDTCKACDIPCLPPPCGDTS